MKTALQLCIVLSLISCGIKEKKNLSKNDKKSQFIERKRNAAIATNQLYNAIQNDLTAKGFDIESYRRKTISRIEKIDPIGVNTENTLPETEIKIELEQTIETYKTYATNIKTSTHLSFFSIMHYEEINSILYEKPTTKEQRKGLKNVWTTFIACTKTEKECKSDAVDEMFNYTSESAK
jgi:hypothetical protein